MAVLIGALCGTPSHTHAQDVGDPELPVPFEYAAPSAKAVYLAGEFNGWLNPDPDHKIKEDPAWLLKKNDAGVWTITVKLKPGNYQYKFVVDGAWKQDPTNPNSMDDGQGGQNSVKTVSR